MKFLSWSEFEVLSQSASDYSISIYLPTHTAGSEIQQDPIRLKNLLNEAEDKLLQAGMEKRDVDQALKEVFSLLENDRFWRHQSKGLALFITPENTQIYRLPLEFESFVRVSDRFYLAPLLPLFFNNRYFYLLALSQNQVRLFQATQYDISEISLEDMPLSMAEALKYDDPEEQLQYHSSGRGGEAPIYHGQGVGTTDDKTEIRRFLNKVDNGLQPYLNTEDAPLVIASVEFLQPIYKEVSTYKNILEEGVYGNPDDAKPDELREQAWPLVAKLVEQSHDDALEQYRAVLGTGKASDRPSDVISAAYRGQVDTLFVSANSRLWGKVDTFSGKVEVHDQPQPGDYDLIDAAAVQTALQSGKVYVLDGESIPDISKAAAIFRYEVPVGV